jgi:hypothetical protein
LSQGLTGIFCINWRQKSSTFLLLKLLLRRKQLQKNYYSAFPNPGKLIIIKAGQQAALIPTIYYNNYKTNKLDANILHFISTYCFEEMLHTDPMAS